MYRAALDIAMPKKGINHRQPTYWWSDELAVLRRDCVKRRRIHVPKGDTTRRIYREKRELDQSLKIYKQRIANAKQKAWRELIDTVNSDVWGLPYKLVMGKLRPAATPLTEALECDFVTEIIKELFSRGKSREPIRMDVDWNTKFDVTMEEMKVVARKMGNKNKTLGPDGLWKGLLNKTLDITWKLWRNCFQECLKKGHFPTRWKIFRLTLIRKPGKPDGMASSGPSTSLTKGANSSKGY